MSARPWSMLGEELADTLEAVRSRRGLPPHRAPVGDLARDLTGAPKAAPALGVCFYCGAPAPNRTVCEAHDDLEDLDPASSEVVTKSTAGGRTILGGSSATTGTRRVTHED